MVTTELIMPGRASDRPIRMNWIARAHRIRPRTRTMIDMPTSPRMRLSGPVRAKHRKLAAAAAAMAIRPAAWPAGPRSSIG